MDAFVAFVKSLSSVPSTTTMVIIFENFLFFTNFSFRRKLNEAWLLIINWYIAVASRVAERLKAF